jgi:peptidoglycan/xylan/chitin deacetylase (PgdA/CDA1 family)
MSIYKKIFFKASSFIPVELLQKTREMELLLPYEHLVSDERLKHLSHLYPYKNKREFIKDLDYLLSKFNPLNPQDLVSCIKTGKPVPPKSFLLSFDDGLREIYDIVAPILSQKGIPAIFFLNPAFIDNQQLFYRFKLSLIVEHLSHSQNKNEWNEVERLLDIEGSANDVIKAKILKINYLNKSLADTIGDRLQISFNEYLSNQKPFLDTRQINELINTGFSIGAHSMDHPQYQLLSKEEQIRQTLDSCIYLKKHFNLSYHLFSFPHKDEGLSQDFFDQLISQKEIKIDLLFGTQNQQMETRNLVMHRFNAERPGIPISRLIKGVIIYHFLNQIRGKNIIKRSYDS